MPRAHQETAEAIADVLVERFESTPKASLDFKRAQRYDDAAEAVLQMLYARGVLPRLPRS